MLLIESLPTVIGTAAVAPALFILWLVIAAGERPGPPAKVWTAFLLGAASISLLGVARAPFASISSVPESPLIAQVLHAVFGVAAPEEIVKVLVIFAVAARRRPFADPMDTVVYGAAAGLGFAAYENLGLSRAACGDVAVSGRIAQCLDRAVPRRTRHHRRCLSCDRAIRNGARRAPASSRPGAHLKSCLDAVCAACAACCL